MPEYSAPLKDMKFVLNALAGLSEVAKLPGYQEATPDTVDAILEEAEVVFWGQCQECLTAGAASPTFSSSNPH